MIVLFTLKKDFSKSLNLKVHAISLKTSRKIKIDYKSLK